MLITRKNEKAANNEGSTKKVANTLTEGVARLEKKDCNEGGRAEHCMRYHIQYGGNLARAIGLLARVCFGRSGRTQTGIGASD
jgi:hypothetical protein